MASKTLIVLLVVACSIHSLNAWPWDKKTTTTTTTTAAPAPAVISRDVFLAKLTRAAENITAEVAKSHQLIQETDEADKVGKAMSKGEVDAKAYTQRFADDFNANAALYIKNNVDIAPCEATFLVDKAEVDAYSLVAVMELIKEDMQDVRDTAAGADALLAKMASIRRRGDAEAAKPDGEYGEEVAAILEEADAVVSTAQWNNAHIEAVVYDFKFAADVAIGMQDTWADLRASVAYGSFCMRRLSRKQQQADE